MNVHEKNVIPGRKALTYRVPVASRADSKALIGDIVRVTAESGTVTDLVVTKVNSFDAKSNRALVTVALPAGDASDLVPSAPASPETADVGPDAAGTTGEASGDGDEDERPAPKSVVPERFRERYGKDGNCGDSLAKFLEDYDTDELIEEAVRIGLITKNQYEGKNPGMWRMNIGNRLRGLIKRTASNEIAFEIFEEKFFGTTPVEA